MPHCASFIRCLHCQYPCGPGQRRQGRCPACYMYWYRHRHDRPAWLDKLGTPRPCRECGVLTRRYRRGLCTTHYMRWYRTHRQAQYA
jgi:hypothetical protein